MKTDTRTKLVQKIYEKTNNPEGLISFGKDPYIRHIKKVFKGYFEKEDELNKILEESLSDKINYKNLDQLLKIILKASTNEQLNNTIDYLESFLITQDKIEFNFISDVSIPA